MTTHDERIATALDQDDQAFLASLETDRGMFEQLGGTMTGPLGAWARFGFVVAVVIGLCIVYSLYRAFSAPGDTAMIGWGLTTIGLLVMQGFLKEWMFARMNMLTVLAEVKRLQVQVALLSEKGR